MASRLSIITFIVAAAASLNNSGRSRPTASNAMSAVPMSSRNLYGMSDHSHPEQRSEVEGSRGSTQPNASEFLDCGRNDVLIKVHIFSAHRGSSLFPQ